MNPKTFVDLDRAIQESRDIDLIISNAHIIRREQHELNVDPFQCIPITYVTISVEYMGQRGDYYLVAENVKILKRNV